MKKFQAVLRSLQLFDATNKLSLTSIALMVIIVKIALAPTIDWTVLTGFFLALLNYTGKKLITKKADDVNAAAEARLAAIESRVQSVANSMALKR